MSQASPTVLIPAGEPLLAAAAWVGHACWTELALHQLLTTWLADEADAARAVAWWAVRADAASRAEAWHRRLPELREFPRPGFVLAPSPAAEPAFAGWAALVAGERPVQLAALLRALRSAYERRAQVAVGAADGPVAATLVEADASLAAAIDQGVGPHDGARLAATEAALGL